MVAIRPAREADARALAEVRVRTWQAAYRDILPPEFLDELSVSETETRWRERLSAPEPERGTRVAESAGQVVGFVVTGPPRDADPEPLIGEVYAIYVLPECWGRGVGRALLARAERDLIDHGCDQAVLWVLADNQRARTFYEAAGWHADGGIKRTTFGGREVEESRYRVKLERSRVAELV